MEFVTTLISLQPSEKEDINLQEFLGSSEECKVPYLISSGSIRKSHEISNKHARSVRCRPTSEAFWSPCSLALDFTTFLCLFLTCLQIKASGEFKRTCQAFGKG